MKSRLYHQQTILEHSVTMNSRLYHQQKILEHSVTMKSRLYHQQKILGHSVTMKSRLYHQQKILEHSVTMKSRLYCQQRKKTLGHLAVTLIHLSPQNKILKIQKQRILMQPPVTTTVNLHHQSETHPRRVRSLGHSPVPGRGQRVGPTRRGRRCLPSPSGLVSVSLMKRWLTMTTLEK